MSLRPVKTLTTRQTNRLKIGPGAEPVTVSELKTHLRISGTAEDVYLGNTLTAGRLQLENYLGIAFLPQTWQLTFDNWPSYQTENWWSGVREGPITMFDGGSREVSFPRFPLASITSITTYDEEDTPTDVTTSDLFYTDLESRPGRLRLKSGRTWPTATRNTAAIEILYVAGFADAASVPENWKHGLLLFASFLYQNRGDCPASYALVKSGAFSLFEASTQVRI